MLMPITTSSKASAECSACSGLGFINTVIGNEDPSVIGARMEMQACLACFENNLKKNAGVTDTTPAPKPCTEYDSPDGRTPVEHYMRGGIECIDAMKAISTPEEFQAFCRLTAFKYLWRLGEKDNPAYEAKKASDYLMWLQQSLESEAKTTAEVIVQAPDKGRPKGFSTEVLPTPDPGGLY